MTKIAPVGPDSHAIFVAYPDPTWILDADTLRFVAVNAATIARYGYSRDEFLSITTHDIRPREEQAGPRTCPFSGSSVSRSAASGGMSPALANP